MRLPLRDNWAAQLNEALPLLEGADWVYLLRAGDRLTQAALLVLADVDLCLKAAQNGYLTVWTPHVQVVHSGLVQADDERAAR